RVGGLMNDYFALMIEIYQLDVLKTHLFVIQ
ncbi:unnamed protein product, partial [marine sediment metagenome]